MQHVPLSHFPVTPWCLPFYYDPFFRRMICVSNWVFWSVRRERYTIAKSGPKHRERQNSQSWAHKLHWGGIILYFLPEVLLFSSSLVISSWTDLWICWMEGKKTTFRYCVIDSFLPLCVALIRSCFISDLCFLSVQPRSILDPKVLGLQTGGWVAALFYHIISPLCKLDVSCKYTFTCKIEEAQPSFTFILHYTGIDTYRQRYSPPWGQWGPGAP